jgi:peptide/nickel transport system permease protein
MSMDTSADKDTSPETKADLNRKSSQAKTAAHELRLAEQVQPMWKIVLRQFVEHRMAVIGAFIIVFYILVALLAPVISYVTGLDPEKQNPMARYQKMFTTSKVSAANLEDSITNLLQRDSQAAETLQKELIEKQWVTPSREEDAVYDFMALPEETLKGHLETLSHPMAQTLKELRKGTETFHVFGTDELGRDVFIRLVYGTRVSMGVGIVVALSSALVGLLIGALAGFYGGWLDNALMRFTDSLLSLPILPVLIVIAAIDLKKVPGLGTLVDPTNESLYKLVFILIITSWMTVSRLVRAAVLSLREREFILAAKTLGAKDRTIILTHLFPNVIAPLLVSVTLGIGQAIIFEATLSFLGLGIQPPTPSWGNMLFNATELVIEAPWLAILPGLQIFLIVVSFNYVGDGLQDAIDPKSVRR